MHGSESLCATIYSKMFGVVQQVRFIKSCLSVRKFLSVWGKEITGNFKERISKIKRTLKSLKGRRDNFSVKLVLEERKKLAEIYVQKEVFWRQPSKQLWLQEGDRNIKFFHSATKLRRKSNQINSLFDSLGNKVGWNNGIEQVKINYFIELFKSTQAE